MRDGLGVLEENAVDEWVQVPFLAAILGCIIHLSGEVVVEVVLSSRNHLISLKYRSISRT